MKQHISRFFSIALASMALATAPASAAVTINLTGNSATSGSYGNVRTFSGSGGGQTITVSASAWSAQGGSITSAYLGSYSNGLGVTNRSEGNGGSNSHTIDNAGQLDFVILQFNRPVDLLSAYLNKYGDTDASFMALTSMPSGSLLSLAQFQSTIAGATHNFGTATSRLALEGTTVISNIWAVSALATGTDTNDSFKLRYVQVNAAPAVPEPATWAMMLLGFFGIGAAMRGRRSGESAALTFA